MLIGINISRIQKLLVVQFRWPVKTYKTYPDFGNKTDDLPRLWEWDRRLTLTLGTTRRIHSSWLSVSRSKSGKLWMTLILCTSCPELQWNIINYIRLSNHKQVLNITKEGTSTSNSLSGSFCLSYTGEGKYRENHRTKDMNAKLW